MVLVVAWREYLQLRVRADLEIVTSRETRILDVGPSRQLASQFGVWIYKFAYSVAKYYSKHNE